MAIVAFGLVTSSAGAADLRITLTGAQAVPPVVTQAVGIGTVTILPDMTVKGHVQTAGIFGTAAHIHQASEGTTGPAILTLVREGNNEWRIPAGAKLTDGQYKAFMDGDLYINIHTVENEAGEIRGQLTTRR